MKKIMILVSFLMMGCGMESIHHQSAVRMEAYHHENDPMLIELQRECNSMNPRSHRFIRPGFSAFCN